MEEEINIAWVSWVEQRLQRSLIDPERKRILRERLEKTQDENEVKTILKEAESDMPILGRDTAVHGQGRELSEAIKFRADLDDYYDRNNR